MNHPLIKYAAACLFLLSSSVFAEERAADNSKPRDCSKIDDASKKTRCEAFNKALEACKGKKVGDELNACLMEQGKKK